MKSLYKKWFKTTTDLFTKLHLKERDPERKSLPSVNQSRKTWKIIYQASK